MDNITEIINHLEKETAYNHIVKDIKKIITGVSIVFLTGNLVYKFNKPLNLGFLDFSTLEKRKIQCEKEIRYNSLITPELYLGVSTINKNSIGQISVDGEGEIIDYAVRMNQVNPDSTMDNLLVKNLVSENKIKDLAKKIFEFHKVALCNEEISKFGSFECVKFNWDENFSQTNGYIGDLISQEDFNLIKDKINHFIIINRELFEKRVKENKIKHCHGDFHSGNVFLDSGKIIIFDGIVFNQRFPCSDIIAEIAFMSMDLDFHNRKELSSIFINEYKLLSNDKDIDKLLNFYKCYRAYIRAKIACFTYDDDNLSIEEKEKETKKAKQYFELAKKSAEKL